MAVSGSATAPAGSSLAPEDSQLPHTPDVLLPGMVPPPLWSRKAMIFSFKKKKKEAIVSI